MKWMVTISNLNLNTIHFAHCVRLVAATRRPVTAFESDPEFELVCSSKK